jgi:protein involved in polysaccharide export with SLBB domain
VKDIDLGAETVSVEPLRDGDVLSVLPNLQQLEDSIRLVGNVYQPGLYEWRDGMLLTDILESPESVRPMSDVNYVLIRREIEPNVFVEAISADLQAAWQQPSGAENLELQPRDTVYVFNLRIGRGHIVEPLLEELRAQAPSKEPIAVARVDGQIRAPGEYPLEPGMRISDLVRAGGGLTEAAYVSNAELTRYEVVGGEYRETDFVDVDLASILRGDSQADLLVTSHDYFTVREVPQWREQQTVELLGEVRFPGVYAIQQGESLSSVLTRAGGLTEYAFSDGSVFLRDDLREREREQLFTLASRVESDVAAISLASETGSTQAITVGQSLVEQLRSSEPVGRLVIDLDALATDSTEDIVLKDGDRLLVPETTQSVTVLGEVQYATSHLYDDTLDRDEYILRSGGLTSRADRQRIYVVRANGEVMARSGSRWFSRSRPGDIRPGDTIVVPMDLDTGRRLAFWGSVTQIIYNLAIAAAAVNSF